MASGGGQVIGTGVVDIKASTREFEAAIKKIPDAARAGMQQTEQVIRGKVQQIRSALNAALSAGNVQLAEVLVPHLAQAEEALVRFHKQTVMAAGGLGKLNISGKQAGMALYQVGAAVDDIQYGLRGALNNISQFAAMLGGPGLGGAVAIAITAAYQLYENWDRIMSLFETRHAIPESTDAIHRLKDALKETNKELEEMKKRSSLNNEELAKFNTLTAKQIDLEKKLKDEQEKRSRIEHATEGPSKEEKKRKQAFESAIEDEGANTLGGIEKALKAESEETLKKIRKQSQERIQKNMHETFGRPEEHLAFVRQEQEGMRAAEKHERDRNFKKESEDLFDQLLQGKKEGRDRYLALGRGYGSVMGPSVEKFEENLPETKEAKKKAGAKLDATLEAMGKADDALTAQAEKLAKPMAKGRLGKMALEGNMDVVKEIEDTLRATGVNVTPQLLNKVWRALAGDLNAEIRKKMEAPGGPKTPDEARAQLAQEIGDKQYAESNKGTSKINIQGMAAGNIGKMMLNHEKDLMVEMAIRKQLREAGLTPNNEMVDWAKRQVQAKISQDIQAQKQKMGTDASNADAEKKLLDHRKLKDDQFAQKRQDAADKVTDKRIALRRAQENLVQHFRKEGGRFYGLTDFAKQVQSGALSTSDFQRRTLRLQEELLQATRDLAKAKLDETTVARAAPG